MFRVAVDTGGTFTDVVAVNSSGQVKMLKLPTDRGNPAAGIIAGLREMAEQWNLGLESFLAETSQIVHGTTLALNALLEKGGARTALLTTAGFRDALEIRRSRRAEQWDLRAPVPPVLVPRRLRIGIRERLDYRGEVIQPIDREQLTAAADTLKSSGIESVAISFLFSFLNPQHEEEAAKLLGELLPGVFITTSAAVAPRIREYERTSTTVLNATLTPVLARYLERLETELAACGWRKPFHLILNSGGLADSSAVRNYAVKTLLSGPAGGAHGGRTLSAAIGRPNIVVADMGGTSFDVTAVVDGACALAPESELAGYPLTLPVIDIHSIGAGGGSVAAVDKSGQLMIGPRSAGSFPGPACYGRGGEEPTVTDAALVLGLLNPDKFLGGRLKLNCDLARDAINRHLDCLGLGTEEAALAVWRVAAAKMADAIRLVTVRKGHDPRDFTLLAAGGAFPLFAGLIASELQISETLIPVQGPVFCAWGMLGAPCQHDSVRSCLVSMADWAPDRLNGLLRELLQEGHTELDRMGVALDNRETEVSLEMKYSGQHHEISVVFRDFEFNNSSFAKINEAFHREHMKLYGYNEPDKPWEIVNLRMICREQDVTNVLPEICQQISGDYAEIREVLLDSSGPVTVRVYDALRLPQSVSGPALLEFPFTSVLVPSGFTASIHSQGFISLCREGGQ